MGYAVELFFDPGTEARLRDLWSTLSAQGISSMLPDLGSRPHISLAVFDRLEPTVLRGELSDFARETKPIRVGLAAVGTFPTAEGVVFVAPTVTHELLDAHWKFSERLNRLGLRSQAYYRPGSWFPHCTVATDVLETELSQVLEVSRQSTVFGAAELSAVGLVSFRPVREIYAFDLEGAETETSS